MSEQSDPQIICLSQKDLDYIVEKVHERVDMEKLAELSAKKAVEKVTLNFYAGVGKTAVEKFLTVVGIASLALYFYVTSFKKG